MKRIKKQMNQILSMLLLIVMIFSSPGFGSITIQADETDGSINYEQTDTENEDSIGEDIRVPESQDSEESLSEDISLDDAEPAEVFETQDLDNNGGEGVLPAADDPKGSIMVQIKWNDTNDANPYFDWSGITRPESVPANVNDIITLWRYTDDPDNAEQVVLQNADESGANYIRITITEGSEYWSCSIGNVSMPADSHFYAVGPAQDSYTASARATEKPKEDEAIKLNYVEYNLDYQPLKISKTVIPADDGPAFSFDVKVSDTKVAYKGGYKINEDGNVRITSSGNVAGVKDGQSVILTQIPAGVSYEVTERNADGYVTVYDSSKAGEVSKDGTSATTVKNISNNVKVTLNKKWNDNNDPKRNEEKFKDSLKLEYKLGENEWAELDADALDTLKIDGPISYDISKPGFSSWVVNATHGDGNDSNFPAAVMNDDGTFDLISYRIKEDTLDGYISKEDEDGGITNTKSEDFNAEIVWKDIHDKDNRPSSVKMTLTGYYIDGEGIRHDLSDAELEAFGASSEFDVDTKKTTVSIPNLPSYSAEGYPITYYIIEETLANYSTEYDNGNTAYGTIVDQCYNGGTITNTRRDTTTYSSNKKWVDAGGAIENRPKATVYLYRYEKDSDASTASPVVIMDNAGKSHVISMELPETENGENYQISFDDILHQIDNPDNEENGGHKLFKYDDEGREYVYFVKEVLTPFKDAKGNRISGLYYKEYKNIGEYADKTDALYEGGTLVNSRIPMVDVKLGKEWKSASLPDAPAGTEVTLKLKVSSDGGNSWSYVMDGDEELSVTLNGFSADQAMRSQIVTLPRVSEEGELLQYKVEEVSVKQNGKDIPISSNGEMTLNNHTYTYMPGTLEMEQVDEPADPEMNAEAELIGKNVLSDEADYTVEKTWSGVTPKDTYVVQVQVDRYLYNGTKDDSFTSREVELTSDEAWTDVIQNLPLYDGEGYRYDYRARETKVLDGDDEVTGDWSVYIDYNYDLNNKKIRADITNYKGDGGKYITVTKKWVDDGDTQHRQPVVAQVYKVDGTNETEWTGKFVTLSEANGWTARIGFDKDEIADYEKGIKVKEYSVGGHEVDYSDRGGVFPDIDYPGLVYTDKTEGHVYKVRNEEQPDGSWLITNVRVGLMQVKIDKIWQDGSRENTDRPNVSVQLYKEIDGNQTLEGAVTLTPNNKDDDDDNKWVYTFEDLKKYDDNGKQIVYTIREMDTSALRNDQYVSTLEDGEYDTSDSQYHSGDVQHFTLTNKREGVKDYKVYKIWNDTEGTTSRPDIRVNLYYSVGDDDTIYEYGKGPMKDYQTEALDYIWSSPADEQDYDRMCTVHDLMAFSPENGSDIYYYSKETISVPGDYKTFYWENADQETNAEHGGEACAADGEYIENRMQDTFNLNGTKLWMNLQNGTSVDELDTENIHITLYHYVSSRPDDFEADPSKYEVKTVSLKEASSDNRNFLFSDIEKYDEKGKRYNFELHETIDGKMGFVYNNEPKSFNITNTFVTGPKNNRVIRVEKDWDSASYTAALAAAQTDFAFPKAVFKLYRSEGISDDENDIDYTKDPIETITVSTESGSHTEDEFGPQLIWSENGIQYKYAVVEVVDGIPAYSIPESEQKVEITDNAAYSPQNMPQPKTASFSNTYEPKTDLELRGTKYWKDENNTERRPDDLVLSVYRRAPGTSLSTIIPEEKLTLDQDYTISWDTTGKDTDSWNYTISGDAIAEFAPNGQRWIYRIVEETVPQYYAVSGTATQNGSVKSGVQQMTGITNNLDNTFTVSKKWDDNNNEYALRPTSVIVALMRSKDNGTSWEYVTEGCNSNDTIMYHVNSANVDALAVRLSFKDNGWKYIFTNLDPAYIYKGDEVAAGVRQGADTDEDIFPYWLNTAEGNKHMIGSYDISYANSESATVVTNTLEPTTLNIVKTWVGDNDNYYDSRTVNGNGIPTIEVKLQRAYLNNPDDWSDITDSNGNTVTKTLSSSENGHTWEVKNLPKCDYLGNNYIYRAVELEDKIQGYKVDYDYTNQTVTGITNTLIERDESVEVKKIWRDGDAASHPPVTVELTRWIQGNDGLENDPYPNAMQVELDGTPEMSDNGESGESEAWVAQWNNLPSCDNDGNEYIYKVEEVAIDGTKVAADKADGKLKAEGYLVSVGQTEATTDGTAVEILNTTSMSYKVTKQFANDTYATRPTSVTLKLQRTTDATIGDTTTWEDVKELKLTGFSDRVASGSHTFENLPKYDANNDKYTYRVIETKIGDVAVDANNFASGYDVSYEDADIDDTHYGNKITNTMRTINITGTKTWVDQSDFFEMRPDGVTVKLYVNDALAKQPDAEWTKPADSDTWTFIFKGLPQYDVNGRVVYTVKETGSYTGYTISNNDLTSTSFESTSVNAGDTVTVTNNSKGIENTLDVVTITGTKTWSGDGANELNGQAKVIRPDSISVDLMNGSTKVKIPTTGCYTPATKDGNPAWTYKFANVPKYDKAGKEIKYTVVETAVPGYTESRDKTNNKLITNTIDTVELTAKKIWDDQGNKYGTRPDGWNDETGEGLFTVYADYDGDGDDDPVKMDPQPTCKWESADKVDKEYTFTVKNLQKSNVIDGKAVDITYTVSEDTVPNGYVSEADADGTIKNTLDTSSITVTKNWDDNNNAYGTRPTQLKLKLQWKTTGDWEDIIGEAAVNWTKNGSTWTYTYADVPDMDADGNVYSYRVVESVPTGYHTTASECVVKDGAASFTNTFDHGYVQVNKVFADTGDNGTNTRPLATFKIENAAKTSSFTVETNSSGKFDIDSTDGSYTGTDGKKFWLIPGDYTITEVSTDKLPDGCAFVTDTKSYAFTVEKDATVTVTNESTAGSTIFRNKAARGTLTLTKMDEAFEIKNGQLVAKTDKGELLGNAQFDVCLDKEGTQKVTYLTSRKAASGNTENGYYVLPDASSTLTNSLGIPYLSGGKLLYGTYYIIETGVPEGYYVKESQSPKQITIASTNTAQIVDITAEMENTLIMQPFSFAKLFEVPNLTSYDDTENAKIGEAGSYQSADAADNKFSFTIERTTDSVPAFEYTDTVETNAAGVADFGNIPYGTYTVAEKAEDEYLGNEFTIKVKADGVYYVSEDNSETNISDDIMEVNNTLKRGKISGTVIDKDINTIKLPNAEVGLYKGDVLVAKVTTGNDGSYSFENIPYGDYTVKEIKSPDKYVLNDTALSAAVDTDGAETKLNAIENEPVKAALSIHKIDNETREPIKDVQFTITGEDFRGVEVSQTLTTDEDGNLEFDEVTVGEYDITEVKVDGYEIPNSLVFKVTSVRNGNTCIPEAELVDTDAEKGNADNSVSSLQDAAVGSFVIANTAIRRDFSFNKTGTDDEIDLTKASPLAGAEFGLFDNEDATGTPVMTVGSDEDGKVEFTSVACGKWYVKELKAPENFTADENIYSFEIDKDGEIIIDLETVVNEAIRGSIKLTKVDMSNHDIKLAGSEYTLYRKNTETGEYEELMKATTDENGELVFENLLIGIEYRVEETGTPAGYQVSDQAVDFILELRDGAAVTVLAGSGNGTVEINEDGEMIWNEPATIVKFLKVNPDGKMLDGAEFVLTDENGRQVFDKDGKAVKWTSSSNEAYTISGVLTAGKKYTLTEKKAPDGYKAAEPLTFEVEEVKAGPDNVHVQEIKVVNEKIPPVPDKNGISGWYHALKTGDSSKVILWAMLAIGALALAGSVTFMIRRRRNDVR